jgi:hypothetical protein
VSVLGRGAGRFYVWRIIMFVFIHFINTDKAITLDESETDDFKTDYESFLSGKKQSVKTYKLKLDGTSIYVNFSSVSYVNIRPDYITKVSGRTA